jgi:hypothetical protein
MKSFIKFYFDSDFDSSLRLLARSRLFSSFEIQLISIARQKKNRREARRNLYFPFNFHQMIEISALAFSPPPGLQGEREAIAEDALAGAQ